jgi:rhodanese-related sulfurtransferase
LISGYTERAMRHLTAEGLRDFLSHHPNIIVLDVRFAHEREIWHIPHDHHVPWYTPVWETNPDFLGLVLQCCSPDDYVLVICSNGYRSCEAAALLELAGFKHIYNVLGGYQDILRLGRMAFSGKWPGVYQDQAGMIGSG